MSATDTRIDLSAIAERLVDAAGLCPGETVLDVATGAGNAAIAAARRGCEVTAVDDVEELPFPDASFDAVLSCLGVMFTPHHVLAAAELLRVCRPGGTIALANWTPAGFVGRMSQSVAGHVPSSSLLWSPGLWGTEDHVRRLLGDAVADLALTRREIVFRFRSATECIEAFRDEYGPVRDAFDALDGAGRYELHCELVALAARHDREPGRSLAIPSEYLEAVAVRAS
jgi:SAM-dependent methyltransferase